MLPTTRPRTTRALSVLTIRMSFHSRRMTLAFPLLSYNPVLAMALNTATDDDLPRRLPCPRCGQTLTFHNSRPETRADGQSELVRVYLCINHGFFRTSVSQPLTPGM
jgi:hypothetical protein